MSYRTIGKCSLCGGPVRVPRVWSSIFPPTAECFDCHAVGEGNGPVIPMRQAPMGKPLSAYTPTYTDTIVPPKRE